MFKYPRESRKNYALVKQAQLNLNLWTFRALVIPLLEQKLRYTMLLFKKCSYIKRVLTVCTVSALVASVRIAKLFVRDQQRVPRGPV